MSVAVRWPIFLAEQSSAALYFLAFRPYVIVSVLGSCSFFPSRFPPGVHHRLGTLSRRRHRHPRCKLEAGIKLEKSFFPQAKAQCAEKLFQEKEVEVART